MKNVSIFILTLLLLNSCVSKKKYSLLNSKHGDLENTVASLQSKLQESEKSHQSQKDLLEKDKNACNQALRDRENQLLVKQTQLDSERNKNKELEDQLRYLRETNTDLLARLSDLAIVSKSGAASIQKSLEAINEQGRYIKDLTTSIQRKDSLNLALITNLKRSLGNINDEDVTIEVKKGVVYISLSDKMLFKSGSAEISSKAEEILGKIAKVVNDHKELDILVEGHTDNVPIKNDCITDNWDLSVKRSTAVVRLLQKKHGVQPERMTAGGRSEYIPKKGNDTAEGRSINRRTEIIITPKLDQFFQLLEPKK